MDACLSLTLVILSLASYVSCNLECDALPEDPCILPLLQVAGIECNSQIDQSLVEQPPTLKYSDAAPTKKYVLVMVDPDAPNLPSGQYFVHLIFGSVSGTDLADGVQVGADASLEYFAPSPPSGFHRYQFFLYEQTKGKLKSVPEPGNRYGFKLSSFIQDNDLCNPVAGFQYKAGK